MKSVPHIVSLFLMSAFAMYVAFYWDIPTDNQIAMAFIGFGTLGLGVALLIHELRDYIRSKKNKPQSF
jgi:hypothetical protein